MRRGLRVDFDQGQAANVCFVDRTTAGVGMPFDDMVLGLAAVVDDYLEPVWGVSANYHVCRDLKPACWGLVFTDDAHAARVLGYHDHTPDGLPLGYVFVRTAERNGRRLSVVASHELIELLTNPALTVAVEHPDGGRFVCREICDPVSAFEWEVPGRPGFYAANFLFPSYFEWFRKARTTRFDLMGVVSRPFEVMPGGYCSISEGGKWTRLFHAGTLGEGFDIAEHPRTERLTRPRREWQDSRPAAGAVPLGGDEMAGKQNATKPAPKPTQAPGRRPPPVAARPAARGGSKPGRVAPPPPPPEEEMEEEEFAEEEGGELYEEEAVEEEAGGEEEMPPEEENGGDGNPAVAQMEQQVQQMGLDWGQVSRVVGLFGQPVLDLMTSLMDQGFSVEWVHDAVTRLEPAFLKLMLDFFSGRSEGAAAAPEEEGGELDESDPCWGVCMSPAAAKVIAEYQGSEVAKQQAGISETLIRFVVEKYIMPAFDKLPAFIRNMVGGNADELVELIVQAILSRM